MTTLFTDCILAEKKINMFSNTEKSSSNSNSISFSKNVPNSNVKYPPSDRRLSLTKAYSCSDASSLNVPGNCTLITPTQFSDLLLQNERKPIPVIDCRSQMDYGCERIRLSYNINCQAKLIAKKLISKRLEDVEPNLLSVLNNSECVILYDQSTDVRTVDKIRTLPINLVVQAANKSNKKAHIIQGGFDAIKSQYPHLIECAVEMPKDKCDQDCIPSTPDTVDKENFTMTQILPHIYVGNIHDSQNFDRLSQFGITHIVNSTPDLPFYCEKTYQYLRVDVLDLPSQNIRKYFDVAYQFIDDALHTKTNNVLVHCSAGISRSPTIVLAYMIKKYHMKLDDAFNKMRQLRQIVDPNVSFILQLRDWEQKCLTNETTDDLNCNTTRSTPNTYCGSTSKSKTDTKQHTDSAIVVN